MDDEKSEFKLLKFVRDEPMKAIPTKYDLVTPDGRSLSMSVEPCGCGMRAVLYQEVDISNQIPEGIPEFLIASFKEQYKGKKRRVEVIEEHMGKITFKDRLYELFSPVKGYERKVAIFHQRMLKTLKDHADSTVVAAGVMNKIRS